MTSKPAHAPNARQRPRAVAFAVRAGRTLIGDEMGLGKTAQAIAAAELPVGHFLATDAGGVSLNLQHAAAVVVNLDVPWNPAVLEQRLAKALEPWLR